MSRPLRFLTLAVIVAACLEQSLLAGNACIERCDCVRVPQAQAQRLAELQTAFQDADVVFAGTFMGIVDTGPTVGSKLRVDQVWKGTPGAEAVIAIALQNEFGTSGGSSCWYHVVEGQHLIFGRKDPSGMWLAFECGETGPVKERRDVLEFLRQLRPRQAEVSGRITDSAGGVLPGVKLLITGDQLRREAITDTEGRFVFDGLALGTYRVDASLTGFIAKSGSITLSSSTPRAHVAWPLEVGCLVDDVRVLFSPQQAAPLVEAVVHLRVEEDRGHVSWSWRPECANVLQSYSTVVLSEKPPRTMDVLLRTADARLHPGREYLAFIWHGSRTGDGLVFQVVSGRVESTAPAPLGGMRVDEALVLIKTWAKR